MPDRTDLTSTLPPKTPADAAPTLPLLLGWYNLPGPPASEVAVMRAFVSACVLLACSFMIASAADPPIPARNFNLSTITSALNEARAIALKQDESQRFWTERTIAQIANIQMRALDFDNALRSIRAYSGYEHSADLARLAEALAADGQRGRATETLGDLGTGHGWSQAFVDDGVQLATVDHLIAKGDLAAASRAADKVKTERYRPSGLRAVAVAYAKAGDIDRAKKHFERSLEAVAQSNHDYSRASAYWEAAQAQLSVGWTADAKATIQRLANDVKLTEPLPKFHALRQAGELSANAGDRDGAKRLFEKALAAQKDVNLLNADHALEQLALSQARCGFFDDAQKTCEIVDDKNLADARRQLRIAIVEAHLKAGNMAAAMRIADSDPARRAILVHFIAKKDFSGALTVTETIDNSVEKAKAFLSVAIAHARAGDSKTAAELAGRVRLSHKIWIDEDHIVHFDFRDPATWGVFYEEGFTGLSWRIATENAAELARLSMTLANLLGQRPAKSYAELFRDIRSTEIVRALARAHAAAGNPQEALTWARQIGSDGKVDPKDTGYEVTQRIDALIGAAEGMLDRMGVPEMKRR
jgi:tetratricopeptide (TPR) repeat protein